MSISPTPRRWVWGLLLLLCLLLVGLYWQSWRGPALPGYQLELRPLVQRVVASGEVDSRSLTQVGSEITGVVRVRHVREGDQVQAGDLLLELRDDDQQARLQEARAALREVIEAQRPQAQASLQEAESNLQQAIQERQRREQLFARQLLSAEQREQAARNETSRRVARDRARLALQALQEGGSELQQRREQLHSAEATLEKTRIRALQAGTVISRAVEPGDQVQPGRTLLSIARADSREIILPLDEKSLAPVAIDQPAQVIADAYPERILDARVSFLAPSVDTKRGTLDVHLELLQPAPFLRQGMTVSVNIETARRAQALVIPNDALFAQGADQAYVLRLKAGRAERVTVRLGLRGTALSEVSDGLQAGDQVLASEVAENTRVRLQLQPVPAIGAQ